MVSQKEQLRATGEPDTFSHAEKESKPPGLKRSHLSLPRLAPMPQHTVPCTICSGKTNGVLCSGSGSGSGSGSALKRAKKSHSPAVELPIGPSPQDAYCTKRTTTGANWTRITGNARCSYSSSFVGGRLFWLPLRLRTLHTLALAALATLLRTYSR